MEVPVESHGTIIYRVRVNVTPEEHEVILKHKWFKLKGRPLARGLGNLFNFVAKTRKPGENLFPELVPIWLGDRVVTYPYVDPEDVPELKKREWKITNQGYAQSGTVLMHRYVMDFPEGLVVDHLGWNRLDNRKEMLRACTKAENARNGSAGYRFGVRVSNFISN
jgi:hypothetical protein